MKVICRILSGEIFRLRELKNSLITLLDRITTKAATSQDNSIELCALIIQHPAFLFAYWFPSTKLVSIPSA